MYALFRLSKGFLWVEQVFRHVTFDFVEQLKVWYNLRIYLCTKTHTMFVCYKLHINCRFFKDVHRDTSTCRSVYVASSNGGEEGCLQFILTVFFLFTNDIYLVVCLSEIVFSIISYKCFFSIPIKSLFVTIVATVWISETYTLLKSPCKLTLSGRSYWALLERQIIHHFSVVFILRY